MKATTTFVALATLLGSTVALPQSKNPFDLGAFGTAYGPAPKGCADFEIIDARGTSEPGSFGLIVGDGIINKVKYAIPGARGYAVQYPADAGKDTVNIGVKDILNRLKTKSVECPNMKYALVGYSQGASVMRAALQGYNDTAIMDKILAMVMFGDPGLNLQSGKAAADFDQSYQPFPTPLYKKLREFCANGDPVCGRGTNFLAHIGYGSSTYSQPAADFIIAAFKGKPLPAKQSGDL